MPNTPDFVAYVVELMKPARAVAKAMFGGHGLYVDELDGQIRGRVAIVILPRCKCMDLDAVTHEPTEQGDGAPPRRAAFG